MQCNATSKRSGVQCRRRAMIGKAVCLMHGGKTPTGIGLPQFQHGRYSKALPARLLERYHLAAADPDLLRLDAEIALTDARITDLLGRVDTGESGKIWATLREQWDLYRRGDPTVTQPMITDLINRGVSDYAAWGEVQALIQARRKLVESERKHLVEQQQMVRLDQVVAVLTAMALSVKAHVTDPSALAAISAEYLRLTAGIGDAGSVVDTTARVSG